MKSLTTVLLLFVALINKGYCQEGKSHSNIQLIYSAAVGFSHIEIGGPIGTVAPQSSFSIPNLKVGLKLGKHSALALMLPGTVYTDYSTDRHQSRGFEGIVPVFQYWPVKNLWLMAGAGLGLDAPAFYDIKNDEERKFYFGTTSLVGAGYEFWHKRKFALDIQSRVRMGSINKPDGECFGFTADLMLGISRN